MSYFFQRSIKQFIFGKLTFSQISIFFQVGVRKCSVWKKKFIFWGSHFFLGWVRWPCSVNPFPTIYLRCVFICILIFKNKTSRLHLCIDFHFYFLYFSFYFCIITIIIIFYMRGKPLCNGKKETKGTKFLFLFLFLFLISISIFYISLFISVSSLLSLFSTWEGNHYAMARRKQEA